MLKNDYRRSMIMLRALLGYGNGFVRLERRTMRGTLQFTVNAMPPGEMRGVMVGQRGQEMVAADLGELRRDPRGQAGMTVTYDPRNIEGMELEQYSLIGVTLSADGECALALSGYLHGSCEVNWDEVQRAVRARLGCGQAGAAPQPASEAEGAALSQEEEPVYTSGLPIGEETPLPPEEVDCPAREMVSKAQQPVDALPGEAPEAALAQIPVQQKEDWPEDLHPVYDLFSTQAAIVPFQLQGFVFVKAVMQVGAPYCAVGIFATEQRVEQVCYAIPGANQSEPPAGLEGYTFIKGHEEGWWFVVHPAHQEEGEAAGQPDMGM